MTTKKIVNSTNPSAPSEREKTNQLPAVIGPLPSSNNTADEPIKLLNEDMPGKTQPSINKSSSTVNALPLTAGASFEMVKLVQDSISKNKTSNPVTSPPPKLMTNPPINKKPTALAESNKNGTILVVVGNRPNKVRPVFLQQQSTMKSASKPPPPAGVMEMKNKKPIPTVKSIKPAPVAVNQTRPAVVDKPAKVEPEGNKIFNKMAIITGSTAKPSAPTKLTTIKPVPTQNKRGYKKRAEKVKPGAAMVAVAEKSAVNKSLTKTAPMQLKENKPISESADQIGVRCSRFGTCGIKVD
jgi:hypothetical protein